MLFPSCICFIQVCLSICIYVCMRFCLYVRPPGRLSFHPDRLSFCLSVRLSGCPPVWLADRLAVCLSVCVSGCLICSSIRPSHKYKLSDRQADRQTGIETNIHSDGHTDGLADGHTYISTEERTTSCVCVCVFECPLLSTPVHAYIQTEAR